MKTAKELALLEWEELARAAIKQLRAIVGQPPTRADVERFAECPQFRRAEDSRQFLYAAEERIRVLRDTAELAAGRGNIVLFDRKYLVRLRDTVLRQRLERPDDAAAQATWAAALMRIQVLLREHEEERQRKREAVLERRRQREAKAEEEEEEEAPEDDDDPPGVHPYQRLVIWYALHKLQRHYLIAAVRFDETEWKWIWTVDSMRQNLSHAENLPVFVADLGKRQHTWQIMVPDTSQVQLDAFNTEFWQYVQQARAMSIQQLEQVRVNAYLQKMVPATKRTDALRRWLADYFSRHGIQEPTPGELSATPPINAQCGACAAPAPQARCSHCRRVWYCNQECADAHWDQHK